ncbi:unnamed protein product [Clavelina lepadiformis]|uniref:Peroxisomal membrane protein 4 n=1 Tax=Clavelina lepadiformis TaxID=159417 RepID=A0ABP0GBW5_CLALP
MVASALIRAFNQLLASGKYQELLALLKGIRNGITYGVKIRFPHALVMTFLFREGTLKEKIKIILKATFQHARNLACFTFSYKFIITVLAKLNNQKASVHGGQKKPWQVIVAASIAGYMVFGENNPINTQINMYLLSRIIFGLCRLGSERGYLPSSDPDEGGRNWFSLFAASVWGIVLYLFEYHRHTLQGSLQSSMTYLYDDSDIWHNIVDFLIYNRLPDA